MDKIKAFLTQKLNKDSFKDVDVKRSIKLTICGALIIALIIQAIGCFCGPLIVSAEDDYSVYDGVWRWNEVLSSPSSYITSEGFIYSDDTNLDVLFAVQSVGGAVFAELSTNDLYYDGTWYGSRVFNLSYDSNSGYNRTNFINYLNSNATKISSVGDIYDFTGETRIFNDELTLFNTSEATWTSAFGFNFEVLGVGTADYLTLQRTTQNNYTMSYSFDFEGSGGLTMIYRDSPPFDDGSGEWLGGKVNRKVITFLSNPEDPEFQQWLLDNTDLFNDVDAAYQIGFTSGYNNGYEEGFGNSLIGDTLKGPIDALSALTIIEVQGVAITLGGVVMTAIALCLVLAFLKLYAGG